MQRIIIVPKKPNICHTNPNINFFISVHSPISIYHVVSQKSNPEIRPMIYGADFVAPYCHYYRNEMQDFGPWCI